MSRGLRVLLGLVLLQGALLMGFFVVERSRVPAAPFAVERLDVAAPPLVVERAGRPEALPPSAHLVHFWATWCGPCQAELPELLAAADEAGWPLLAVSDEPWPTLEAWFGGPVPPAVVRDPAGGAAADWGVSGLPDTFVVVDGRVVARMGGPRDWSGEGAERFLEEVAR